MTYSYAKLSRFDLGVFRIIGSGLGNLLFPWARWIVATRKHSLVPISPTWLQFQVGPILRQERDKRIYYGLFRTPENQVRGARKIRLLYTLPRVSEAKYSGIRKECGKNEIVVFEGLRDFFSKIIMDHEVIKKELLYITKERHKKGLGFDFKNAISVHVRLGDFAVPSGRKALLIGRMNYRIPISWYIAIIDQIRKEINRNMPVYIFSDGTDKELRDLLALPNCSRISFGSSIADLLALSRANVLVGSASTFSMWASFLGRMPVIWYKGQMRHLYYDQPDAEAECGENEAIPPRILEIIERRMFNTTSHRPLEVYTDGARGCWRP